MLRSRFALPTVLALALAVAVSSLGVVSAATKSTSKNGGNSSSSSTNSPANLNSQVTASYNADPAVQLGMLVKLKDKDPKTVVPVTSNDSNKLLGVVIPSSNATIVLTPQNVTQQQVLVTNNGHFTVLVSNQNGPVKTGDYIAVSAVDGIGMKAGENDDSQVVGKAAGNFSGAANVIGTVELKDTLGRKAKISIGRVPIDIAIAHNPLFQRHSDYVPAGLGKLAQTVSSHPVSTARIYLSGVLLLVSGFITINMFYSGIRGGMVAVGRNPLSRKSIMRSLIQTVIAGLIVFTGGVFAVYLILKL